MKKWPLFILMLPLFFGSFLRVTANETPAYSSVQTIATDGNSVFTAPALLGSPTDHSVIINIIPAIDMQIYTEYGTSPGIYNYRTDEQPAYAGQPFETLIDGLQPNTRYYYRFHSNNLTGEEHSFITQRAPGSSFVFDVQGDSHPERKKNQFSPELYTRTLQSAAADTPDFYLTIGDDFSVDALKKVNQETVKAIYVNQRQYLGLVGAPVFLVNGNHEQESPANLNGTPDNVAVWANNARNAYYPQPIPDDFYSGDEEPVEYIGLRRDYYAFTWGDALFVVLDPYWHSSEPVETTLGEERMKQKKSNRWNTTLGETQYRWLKQTLETSPAKYKFVFAHHVNGGGRGGIEVAKTFEWGDVSQYAQKRPGWEKTIHQLMVDNHVTIFFQGHDHIFVRQELDGVIYQTLPEPGNPKYSYGDNEKAYRSGDKYPSSGHARVNVSPETVTVDYIRSYLDKPDELAFSYSVE